MTKNVNAADPAEEYGITNEYGDFRVWALECLTSSVLVWLRWHPFVARKDTPTKKTHVHPTDL